MVTFKGLFGGRERPAPERIEPPIAAAVEPAPAADLTTEQAAPSVSSFSRSPYGGHPAAGLTPVSLAVILRASIDGSPRLYLELAEDMEERFIQYGSTLSTRKRAVRGMEMSVEAAGESTDDEAEAELVRQVIASASFRLALIDILDAIGKGYSCVEMIWDTASKPWKPVQFKHRDPRWFEFDRTDPDKIMLLSDHGLEELWPHRWIVHKAKAKSGLTVRGGIARQAAWLFLFQSYTLKDWAIFTEAFGQPARVGKFDPGASEIDKKKLLEAVHNLGADYAAIIPVGMAIEFINAEISGSTDLYERRADWLDKQCSKIVLGQTGTTDTSGGSGYAQAKVHDDVREDISEADAEQLAATLNEYLVPSLIDLNFPARQREGYPTIVVGRPEEEDVEKWVDNVAKVVPLGVEVSIAEVQRKIGITPPDPQDRLLKPRAVPDAGNRDNDGDKPPTSPEASRKVPAAVQTPPDAIGAAIEEMLSSGWEPIMTPIGEDLRLRIATANSVDEVKAELAAAFAGMDVGSLTSMLANAMFQAHLAGELDEDL